MSRLLLPALLVLAFVASGCGSLLIQQGPISQTDVEAMLIRSQMGYYQNIHCRQESFNGWDFVCTFRANTWDGPGRSMGVAVDGRKIVAASAVVNDEGLLPPGPHTNSS